MTLKKRLLALCMAVVMVFSLCSISALQRPQRMTNNLLLLEGMMHL